MKRVVADTFALVVFCTLAAGLIELFVVGLSASQIMQTRLAALPAIVLTARPYGVYRDLILRRFGGEAAGPARAALLDIIAFVTFQAPVYAAILVFAGATAEQIVVAIPTAVFAMIACGRLYGVFLDWVRRAFGVVVTVEAG